VCYTLLLFEEFNRQLNKTEDAIGIAKNLSLHAHKPFVLQTPTSYLLQLVLAFIRILYRISRSVPFFVSSSYSTFPQLDISLTNTSKFTRNATNNSAHVYPPIVPI